MNTTTDFLPCQFFCQNFLETLNRSFLSSMEPLDIFWPWRTRNALLGRKLGVRLCALVGACVQESVCVSVFVLEHSEEEREGRERETSCLNSLETWPFEWPVKLQSQWQINNLFCLSLCPLSHSHSNQGEFLATDRKNSSDLKSDNFIRSAEPTKNLSAPNKKTMELDG